MQPERLLTLVLIAATLAFGRSGPATTPGAPSTDQALVDNADPKEAGSAAIGWPWGDSSIFSVNDRVVSASGPALSPWHHQRRPIFGQAVIPNLVQLGMYAVDLLARRGHLLDRR